MSNGKIEGTVRGWLAHRGFGTIGYVIDGVLHEAWFSFAQCIQVVKRNEDIPLGTKVKFNLDESNKSARRLPTARDVEVLIDPVTAVASVPATVASNEGAR